MNITIEHIFAIAGIELIITAGLINIITGSLHYFSEEGTRIFYHSSNGFGFLMAWASIYGIFALLYFIFGMMGGRFKEEKHER